MPITKSAKKAIRQGKRRRTRNLKQSRLFKDKIKALRKAVVAKDKRGANELLPEIYRALDKAVKTNVLRRNTAARLKSRLTKAVNKL